MNTSYDLNQIPDTRPLPDEIAMDNLDGAPQDRLRQFAAAVGSMPPHIAHAICRAIGGLESIDSISDIARLSGVSVSTIYRHLAEARQRNASPCIGSSGEKTLSHGVRRGAEHRETNAKEPDREKRRKTNPKNPAQRSKKIKK